MERATCASRTGVVLSSSAHWFHLLREPATVDYTKPRVVMSQKTQLHGNPASQPPLEALVDCSDASVG
jgi:2-oxoglutarate dehydrogenase complex dehydrogenase (E1) component-like enzyme